MNPTHRQYFTLSEAYDHFNRELFNQTLPPVLLTMQRKARAYGYCAKDRFKARGGEEVTDEIALNPKLFVGRSDLEILSTLVHEMTHVQQFHFGKPSRGGYHNREWADMMKAVGLIPSDTGEPGGKITGQRMTHYIEPGGKFERAALALLQRGQVIAYNDAWGDNKTAKTKAASKTKFTCPKCEAKAWAKPAARLICGDCSEKMVSAA